MPKDKPIGERVATLEQFQSTQEKMNKTMAQDIKDIKEKLLGRPTWSIMLLISGLSTLSGSLIVYLLTK